MSDLLKSARAEEASLLEELSHVPAYGKLQIVQRFIRSYEPYEPTVYKSPLIRVEEREPTEIEKLEGLGYNGPATRRPGSRSGALEEVAVKVLAERGFRGTSGVLLPLVMAAGGKVRGKSPAKSLASVLSNSRRINNVKNEGYGLAEWGNGPGPKAMSLEGAIYAVTPHENEPSTDDVEDGSENGQRANAD